MIALVTSHSVNNLDVYNASLPNHEAYCRRHGYALLAENIPYDTYLDVDHILTLLKTYDTVVTMGCDLLIQHLNQPLTDFLSPGISMGSQHSDGELNADLIIYNNTPTTIELLEKIRTIQHNFVDSQQCFRHLYKQHEPIKCIPTLQIAYPPMNTHIDYRVVDTRNYFAMHFMRFRISPNPGEKAQHMKQYLELHTNNGFVKDCRIALVTFDNRLTLDWVKLTNRTKQHYCDLRGFDFVFSAIPYYKDRKPNWNKLPLLKDTLLSGKYDYVVWMDSDAIIANPLFDATMLLDDHDIFISEDCYNYNSGVFALKNSKISVKFLEDAMSDELREKYKDSPWEDQSTMIPLLRGKYKEFVREVPIRAWNCYDNAYTHPINNEYHEGDFVLHLPDEGALNNRAPNYRAKRFGAIVKKTLG